MYYLLCDKMECQCRTSSEQFKMCKLLLCVDALDICKKNKVKSYLFRINTHRTMLSHGSECDVLHFIS